MFEEVKKAVEDLVKLCNVKNKAFSPNRPLKNTEVYNEGWMLRLVVSKLRDQYCAEFSHNASCMRQSESRDVAAAVALEIGKLASRGWCSEGFLASTFNDEGSTRADGIVGDIVLRPRTKWGFECISGEFAAIEAKAGSGLSKGVVHLPKLNQAARYIAIIARMMSEGSSVKGRLFVIASEDDFTIENCIHQAKECLKAAFDGKGFRTALAMDSNKSEMFWHNVENVVSRSCCVNWKQMMDAIQWGDDADFIFKYYTDFLEANKK